MRARAASLLSVLPLLMWGGTSVAEDRDPVAAEALFSEARALVKAGKFSEACSKLEASQRLDPGVGTLLNLGECYERSGMSAKAWATYREAAAAAAVAHQEEREKIARARTAAIEPKLCQLRIEVPHPREDLVVERDGTPMDRALWGTSVPVDTGEHEIKTRSGGAVRWSTKITIPPSEGACAVSVVELPALTTPPPQTAPSSLSPPPAKVPHVGPLPFVLLGVAAVGIGAGAYFGVRAKSEWDDARSECTDLGCPDHAQALSSDARNHALFSTISFVAGGVAAAGGILILLTSGTGRKEAGKQTGSVAPWIGGGMAGAAMRGSF